MAGCSVDDGLDRLAFAGYEPPAQPDAGPPPPEGVLRITGIQVANLDSGESGLLEMEVHLYDANSGGFLGCSGAVHGMLTVDRPDIPYALDAYFVRPGGVTGYPTPRREWLTYADVQGRTLKLVVVEDDQQACPAANGAKDKVFDQRVDVSGTALRALTTIPMTNVLRLVVGVPGAL